MIGRDGENHEAVGVVLTAEIGDEGGLAEGGHIGFSTVKDYETVPGSGEDIECFCHLIDYQLFTCSTPGQNDGGKSHNYFLVKALAKTAAKSLMPGSILDSSTKEKLRRMVLRWLPSG